MAMVVAASRRDVAWENVVDAMLIAFDRGYVIRDNVDPKP